MHRGTVGENGYPYGYEYEELPLYSENVSPNKYPGYKLISPIGKGYFGTVWKALRLVDDKIIALKTVKIPENDNIMLNNLLNEVKILTKISSPICQPFLVCFNDYMYLKDINEFIIDMNLIEGKNLLQYANTIFDINVKYRHLLLILKDIIKPIKYLHDNGIIHNDIKPDNIIIDDHLTPILVDFGVSCLDTQKCVLNDIITLCCTGVKGPNLYISPETLKTNAYYTQSDIWSLGVTFYVAATGGYPFVVSKNVKELYYHIRNDPLEKLDTSNEMLNYIVNRALDKNSATRITLSEIAEILQNL